MKAVTHALLLMGKKVDLGLKGLGAMEGPESDSNILLSGRGIHETLITVWLTVSVCGCDPAADIGSDHPGI